MLPNLLYLYQFIVRSSVLIVKFIVRRHNLMLMLIEFFEKIALYIHRREKFPNLHEFIRVERYEKFITEIVKLESYPSRPILKE